jgi:hypothetical protein
MGWTSRNWKPIPGRDMRLFSFPKHPNQLWEPPTLLFSGYQESLSLGGKKGQGMKLASQSVAKVKNVWI